MAAKAASLPRFWPQGAATPFAYKAQLRISGPAGHSVAPPLLFAVERAPSRTVLLDRLCRVTHCLNFVRHGQPDAALHLNVHALHLINLPDGHGEFFSRRLPSWACPPHS